MEPLQLIRRFFLILLLLSSSLCLAEDVLPNDEDNPSAWGDSTGSFCATLCDSTNCSVDVDDDPQSPTSDLNATITDSSIRYEFATPTDDPSLTTDAQTIEIATIKMGNLTCNVVAGGGSPLFTVDFSCGGVNKENLVTDQALSSDTQLNTYTFTYINDGDCDAAGANLQILVAVLKGGGGPNQRRAAIEAIRWVATVGGVSASKLMVIGK